VALVTASTAHLFRNEIITLFTVSENIIDLSLNYYNWLLVFPFVVGIGLVFYGVFTGATCTVPIRNSTIGSLFLFLISYFSVIPYWGNHGLWLSFIVFSLGRSLFLMIYLKKLRR
jgi:MATE family multidrug resistance protein